jgi:hypothetical protein
MANYITAPMAGLEDLLIASTTFCASIEGNPGEQFIRDNHIYWGFVEHDPYRAKKTRPLAVINDTESMAWNPDAESYGAHVSASGSVELYLTKTTEYQNDHKRSLNAFAEWAGNVIQEIAEKMGTDNYYPFSGIQHATQCLRSPRSESENYDFFFVLVELSFDAGGAG